MTKSEHQAKHPDAWDMLTWNIENEEKYTEAEINA